MLKPPYLYLSGSAFLVRFTASNKQLASVKSVFKSFDHASNLYEIYKLTIFYEGKVQCFLLNRFLETSLL